MPVLHIHMLSGKTPEQKKAMVKSVTEAIVKSIEVEAEKITIFIKEFEKEDIGKAGLLYNELDTRCPGSS
ncbi:MAG: 2-hydroxymuconate tautomerase [Bacillota bacterium]